MTEENGKLVHIRNGMRVVSGPEGFDAEASPALATFRVGGREVPWFSEPRCKVCNSKFRVEIERALGWRRESPGAIAKKLPEDAGLNAQNIYEHAKRGHLIFVDQMRTTVVLARAIEMGQAIEEDAQIMADQISYAKSLMSGALDDFLKGNQTPTLAEGLLAAKFLQAVEEQGGEGGGLDLDNVAQVFMTYWQSIRKHATPEAVRAIAEDVRNDPVLRALVAKSMRDEAVEVGSGSA